MIDYWHMKRIVAFCVLLMIFSTKNASAFYIDYMVRYNSTGCHMVNNETQCGPVASTPQDKIMRCNFFFDTKACCCEGLVWIPDAPVNVTAETSGNTIVLSWDNDPTADYYKIYWMEGADYAYVGDEEIVVRNGNSFTHKGLKYDTTYAYRIVPFNVHTVATEYLGYFYRSTSTRATTGPDPNPPPIDPPPIDPPIAPAVSYMAPIIDILLN